LVVGAVYNEELDVDFDSKECEEKGSSSEPDGDLVIGIAEVDARV